MNRESKIRLIACWTLAAAGWAGLAAAQAPKPAEPLGRLFFTPAQRAQLDVARKQRARTALAAEGAEEVTTAAPTPQTITYDGVVQRSDGKSTVWINSRPAHEKESASGGVIVGRVRADGGVSLQIPQSGRSVNLKPGQSIELLSGAIEEKYTRKPAVDEPKPAAKPGAEPKPPATSTAPSGAASERDKEDQQRKVEEAVRVLQEAAAKSGTPFPPPQPQTPAR